MNNFSKKAKKALSTVLVAVTTAWTIGASVLVAPLTAKAAVAAGSLVKASLAAVYYVGTDGKRYVFPNEKTYFTWYADFSGVQTITDAELASLVIGGNVTYRPGVKMVKIQSDPKVYAVDAHGTLRHVTSESLAVALYGSNWNHAFVEDVSDAFFTNYTLGAAINSTSDFNPTAATAAATSISVDKGLTAVSGSVSVSLDSSNPAATSIISDGTTNVAGSQARIPALAINFSGSGTVDTLTLHRGGISADSDIDNVYLYDGNTPIAEMLSLSNGIVTFQNANGLFSLNGSKTITVKFDLNKDVTSNKSISFSMISATDVVLDGGANVAGSFPFLGNSFTVAAVSDFGRLQLTTPTGTSSTVDAGTSDFEAFRFQLVGTNQDIKINRFRFKMLGSINSSDLTDMKLFVGGVQIGSTVTALDGDKYATFDLTAAPYLITNGSTRIFSLRVNVMSGSTRTIQFSLQKPYDLDAMDANYNVSLNADSGTAGVFSVATSTSATVNAGTLTVTRADDSPQGVVALNATNVSLAKFKLQAVGESLKFSSIDINLASTTGSWTNLRNVRLLINGSQVGTTQSSVADGVDTTITTNFTIQPLVDNYLEIRSDAAAASGAGDAVVDGESVTAVMDVGSSNVQRLDSLGTFNGPSADVSGNEILFSSSALTPAANSSLGAVTVVQSQSNARIGSYLLTSNTSEDIDLSTLVFVDRAAGDGGNGSQSIGASFTNLTLKKDGVVVAPVVTPNTSDAAGTTYTFNLSPILRISANSTISLDLYADALSNANATWTDTDATKLSSFVATGVDTGSAVTSSAVIGQGITVASAGTLSLSLDGTSPIASQHVMGATDKTFGVWKFDSDNTEDITISQIIVKNDANTGVDNTAISNGNIKNIKLFVGGVQVGSTIAGLNGSSQAVFGGLNIVVPRNGSALVTVKADLASFTDNSAGVGDPVQLELNLPATINEDGTNDFVIARGASGTFATAGATTGDFTSESQFPYRTTLSASIACSGSCSGRTRSTSDIVGKLSLTGGSSTDAQFRTAMQINDDTDEGAAGNNWQVVAGATGNAVAADTSISLDGASISWTATGNDWDADDLLVYDLPATADLSGFSRVSFWIQATGGAVSANDISFFTNSAANTTGIQQTLIDTALVQNVWHFIDLAMPTGTAAADDFAGLRAVDVTDLDGNTITGIKIDEVRFYNDSINIDVSGNLCDTAANCVVEDGAGTQNNPNGQTITLQTEGGTIRGVGYFNAGGVLSAVTTGTVEIFIGANLTVGTGAKTASDLTPSSAQGLLSIGAGTQTFNLIANTSALVDSDSTATEVLSLSMDLGNGGGTSDVPVAGDFLWWDQGVTATSPINFLLLGVANPINVNLGY